MILLYRGVSKRMDSMLNGELKPKGSKSEVTALHDGKIRYDDTFTHGETEDNAARAQHIETGLYDNCFVSTTKDEKMAALFATNKHTEPGWVYVINSSIFMKHNIVSKEFPDPLYPDEIEVSIRAADCGNIPSGVVVEKYEVDSDGKRKT